MSEGRDWRWYGYSGHFICGQWCRFHLCTKVGKYLVSTVGRYVHPRNSGSGEQSEREFLEANPNGEEVGCGRFYETMVFKAGAPCSAEGCDCGLPDINGINLDFSGYQTAAEATKGHYKLCAKWDKKNRRGK